MNQNSAKKYDNLLTIKLIFCGGVDPMNPSSLDSYVQKKKILQKTIKK